MTFVEVALRLPDRRAAAAVRILVQLVPEEWNRRELTGDLSAVMPAELAEELARFVLAEAPNKPRPRVIADIIGRYRLVDGLEPESLGDVSGLALPDVGAVARMLDVTVGELEWFADHGEWLRHSSQPLRHYRIRRMSKPAGGVRVIEAPKPRLAEAQRRILRRVLDPAAPHPAARGFRPGGSVLAYAAPHVGTSTVVRLDLRDCFSTVTVRRVRGVFQRLGYPRSVAGVLADLCTVATPGDELRGLDPWQAAVLRSRHLPQGAPSSPALVNMALRKLDARLAGLARSQHATYTRYGDDLAFSGALDPSLLTGVVPKIGASEGFSVNPAKTRVMRSGARQELAGVVVNARAQAPRADYDALRALLYNAARFGADSQNRDDRPDFRAYVYGRIAWVGQGNPARRERLLDMAARVRW